MSTSRLEKFIYAICSMEVSDLPAPLSRIEILWNCLITGETPDFEPQSRNEQYLMAMLGLYELENLPTPISRGEKLLYKIAMGETDLSDVPGYLSRYEELLKYLIENGGISGGDFEYVLYTLNQSLSTLYATVEKPVKSAILKGCTGYRDIDTGEILETFEEGRNLELVSVKMPVLKATGKNLLDSSFTISKGKELHSDGTIVSAGGWAVEDFMPVTFRGDCVFSSVATWLNIAFYTEDKTFISIKNAGNNNKMAFTVPENAKYFRVSSGSGGVSIASDLHYQIEQGAVSTTYEPFKSNILTVNEDIMLRGIGDVQDTLDLMTGEKVERIGEIVLDGSENWSRAKNSDGTYRFGTVIDNMYNNKLPITPKNIFIKADKLPIVEFTGDTFPTNSISAYGNIIVFYIDEIQEISDFKAWLSQNPTTVQYQLATESIKTVDLITVDQDGQPTQLKTFNDITHVELSSEGLIPEVELEVATKINETLLTMSPQHHDISETQNKLGQTIDEQTENTDAAMLATTEIYEQTL